MLCGFQCPNCGEYGWILSEAPAVAPRCLRCGHRLIVEPPAFDGLAGDRSAIDDRIVSWLSEPQPEPMPRTDAVASCVSCGFESLMQYESSKGDTICPACLAVSRTRPERVSDLIDCPHCTRTIEVYESDRGKTIVCPDCKYFLGCVLMPEKRRFGTLPFLNALLAAKKS